MNVFNPKILDASIRDISACLTDNQKVDLLLYAIKSLHFEGRSRIVVENAIQSCLQVTTLSSETIARARILRARARIGAGSHLSAQEGYHHAPLRIPSLSWTPLPPTPGAQNSLSPRGLLPSRPLSLLPTGYEGSIWISLLRIYLFMALRARIVWVLCNLRVDEADDSHPSRCGSKDTGWDVPTSSSRGHFKHSIPQAQPRLVLGLG